MSSPANGSGAKDGGARAPLKENGVPDAGLRSLDHYKRALPPWRYDLRQRMLPLVRWETPYLAYLQDKFRTPALDSYFAITANLGTHTFFMIGLPILFWCGYPAFGKGLVHILAFGVFFTGWIKDFCSLPRPLSPPLNRITMSGSAALEYGFPSTHSANAVSVAVYGIFMLYSPDNMLSAPMKLSLEVLSYFYALSIVVGRLYCGMHGFVDVVAGSACGAFISLVEFKYGPTFDEFMHGCSWLAPVISTVIIILLVGLHPEPADDCPCFDDSVAFAGVVIGLEIGTWTYGRLPWNAYEVHAYGTHDIPSLSLPVYMVRIVLGVFIVFAWREIMKPTMLRGLPHLFRLIERAGLSLPRRFFMPASQYKTVPENSRIDTLIPSVSDIPRVVESIRHPKTRGRSISIGPQSAADAYETLAYRERRRRESVGSNSSLKSRGSLFDLKEREDQDGSCAASGATGGVLSEHENTMWQGRADISSPSHTAEEEALVEKQNELEEKEMFARLPKSRTRYDVEVVTKLVVYTGIAWWATAIIPMIFEAVGLGYSQHRTR